MWPCGLASSYQQPTTSNQRPATSNQLLRNAPPDRAAGQHAAAQERALQRAFAVAAASAEAGGLADGVQPWDRVAVGGAQHAALEIGLDAAQALARQNELANGNQRPRLGVEDLLEIAGPHPVPAIFAAVGNPAQLLVA